MKLPMQICRLPKTVRRLFCFHKDVPMKKIITLILTVFIVWSCTSDGPSGPDVDDFDREAILVNWADNIIIPAFTHFSETTGTLHSDAGAFSEDPTLQRLETLRESWKSAYLAFQSVSIFEMGTIMNYRDFLNTYPTTADSNSFNPEEKKNILENIETSDYNLELPSTRSTQGFPALDYMLNGLAENDAELLFFYTSDTNSENYRTYLTDLTQRIDVLANQILNNWTDSYRDEFVSNSGKGANSSLDMMVNDFIFYYETLLRKGKIGIPAGVFSGTPLSTHVEAYHSKGFSKALFNEALDATQKFFNGTHFDSNQSGESLSSYLDFLNTMKEGADLASLINNQFNDARDAAESLNENFATQVESDNSLMLSTYDELQKNVVFMKVDMLQALNVNVDYVDADGD